MVGTLHIRLKAVLVYPVTYAHQKLPPITVWTGINVSYCMVWSWLVQVGFDRTQAMTGTA